MTMHERHRDWLSGRGIDPALAEAFGIKTTKDGSGYWLTVPYVHKGEPINHKYRQTSEKRHRMDPGAPLTLWNADCLSDPAVRSGAPVIITEGEWDALAALTVGFKFVVSVPNGAPSSETNQPEEAKRYSWVWEHIADLDKVQTFIIAADEDPAGRHLLSDIVSLLGADRCKFVEYPFPCKDLNEVLVEYGAEAVVDCLNRARNVPIKGLYKLADFPERGEVRHYSLGVEPIRDKVYIVPGTLTVVTGYANMGKSTLMNQILAHTMRHHFPVCVASFETDVKPILRDELRKSILQCDDNELRKVDLSDADDILAERLTIITQAVDEDAEMTLEAFLEYCRIAVQRDGVKMVLLDPWNELEHKRRRDETETEYISRSLRAIKRFAKQYDVAFWIVAHPSKPGEQKNKPPGLYDISGSANWANKADYGLCYHRPQPSVNFASIIVNKVRMGLPGSKGSVDVTYDFRCSQFVAAAPQVPL